jgi:hypothetical protein
MPVITSAPKAIDVDVLVDAARAALLASSAVTAITSSIFSEIAVEGSTGPYVVLSLPSVVYESTYQGPTINALLDVSAYTTGNSTTMVRALITACLAALIDSAWAIAGMTTVGATMEMSGAGMRSLTEVSNGVLTRGRQFTLRVIALKT